MSRTSIVAPLPIATRPPKPPARGTPLPRASALRRRRSLWACELILGFWHLPELRLQASSFCSPVTARGCSPSPRIRVSVLHPTLLIGLQTPGHPPSKRSCARHLPRRCSCRSPRWLYAGAFAGPSMQRTPERSRGRAEHHLGDWQVATFSPHHFPYRPSTPPASSRLQSR